MPPKAAAYGNRYALPAQMEIEDACAEPGDPGEVEIAAPEQAARDEVRAREEP
jgi:hypothetical protein